MEPNDNESIREQHVRVTAYLLWEQDGRPDSDPVAYWEKALEIHRLAGDSREEVECGIKPQAQPAPGTNPRPAQ